METINDDELRSALSRYLDVVPPVTESTRATLIAKLKKCISNGSGSTQMDDSQNCVNIPSTECEKMTSVDEPAQTAASENGRVSPINDMTIREKPLFTKELSASFMNGLPVRNQSSPVLDYVSRLPSYRRRSIHPDRPGIADPYSNDLTWFPSLSPSTRSRDELSNKRKAFQNTKGILRANLTKSFLYITIGLISVIFDFCLSSFSKLTNAITSRIPSFRICICLVLFGLLLLGLYKILIGDPFYHNPVEDLYDFIQFPFFK
ncbi:Lamino-associated polypeptide 2/emerin [Schistosoma japonicum]|uniref:Lamino-associated polypeptide 2/emerin,domain-containing protein n=2 Tax=Schistosoma japonicum TaxID=6182 RepID=C1LJC7_SCHJA|nr:Lamino-associated polypeptide 2/emerin [Schistosoma japonicum]CAX74804.1 Lamino-associated polypeptide 2/emerin,domain-containing protein [Schistosoma japonicum]CAX74805.1 Lamino-associated polypeptide 2/emerin,domain-containing protein [Schistosoma japonicum]